MISRIKNPYLRRTALIVGCCILVPLEVILTVAAALWDLGKETVVDFRACWRGA